MNILDILKKKQLIDEQIDVYLAFGSRVGILNNGYKQWLDLFVRYYDITDVADITNDQIDGFITNYIEKQYASICTRITARKAINGIKKYYEARTKNVKKYITLEI